LGTQGYEPPEQGFPIPEASAGLARLLRTRQVFVAQLRCKGGSLHGTLIELSKISLRPPQGGFTLL
jgi:hypothetical protein